MILSPFSPIFFPSVKSDGIESRYTQIFSPDDHILLQYVGEDEKEVRLVDGYSGIEIDAPAFQSWQMGSESVWECDLCHLTEGLYKISVDGVESLPFLVTADESLLRDTILIQYSHRNNRQRTDVAFVLDDTNRYFTLRVHGGFKGSEVTFSVDNEQYITPLGDLCELYALESMSRTLTIGTQEGVPMHFAELLNRLLTCSHVYVDGLRYQRKDNSVPELTAQMEGLDSFVVKVNLQRVEHTDPTLSPAIYLAPRIIGGGG